MAPPQLSSNTVPILALVGAKILSLMAFVGVCEAHASDIALCESRWSPALPAIALAGQSAATYFMASGRREGQAGEHVLMGQLGEVRQQLGFRASSCQGPQHITHGEAGPAHTRLPKRTAGLMLIRASRSRQSG